MVSECIYGVQVPYSSDGRGVCREGITKSGSCVNVRNICSLCSAEGTLWRNDEPASNKTENVLVRGKNGINPH